VEFHGDPSGMCHLPANEGPPQHFPWGEAKGEARESTGTDESLRMGCGTRG